MLIASQVLYSVESGLFLLALCVLVGPILAERLRIPGLVGLIAIGTLLGPGALAWLRPGGFVATVGAAGLLYLMFLAGVELDLKTFAANRVAALTFGLLTFCIPFALSAVVASVVLDLDLRAAALVGAMWASHTVVAYPEAKAAGLDRNRAVGAAVAATVITDVLALVVLAVAASSSALEQSEGARASIESPALPLWAGLVLVVGFSFGVLPRLTRWAFTHVWHTRTQRFVWVLAGMSAGAIAGLLGGIEGLVGAFLAGIGMNTSVPARSELMERIEFVGNALLVPAFLVSVGLSIDPGALVEPSTLRLAALFTTLVVVGKVVPAVIAGRLFGFGRAEVAIMAALTIGQAAATLAIAQVGVATGLFDQEVLNAAVVTVVATVLITSFGTRRAARAVPVSEASDQPIGAHVLALAPALPTTRGVASLVSAIARADGGLVTPYAVRGPGPEGTAVTAALAAFDDALVHQGHDTHPVERISTTLVGATQQLVHEQEASLVVLPLPQHSLVLPLPLADEVDEVGATSTAPCLAVSLATEPWRRILVLTGHVRRAPSRRHDVELVAEVVGRLVAARPVDVVVCVPAADDFVSFAGLAGSTMRTYVPRSGGSADLVEPGDLVVVPTHVVADAGGQVPGALEEALASASVVVVGGAGRLRVTAARAARSPIGAVAPRQG